MEHRHRFAVWAAARAAQRGFTSVEILRRALQATDIRSVVSNPAALQLRSTLFDELHRRWCSAIYSHLKRQRVDGVTYGRAAKLVAVYLKATVILGDGADTPFGRAMHPAIDRILLQDLAASPHVASRYKAAWRRTTWTELNERQYYKLIGELRDVLPPGAPFWIIEKHWIPPREGDWRCRASLPR